MAEEVARQRLSGLGQAGHRRHLLQLLTPVLADHPFERLTLVNLARLAGVSMWVLRSAFGNPTNLLSAATSYAMDEVLGDLDYTLPDHRGVRPAIAAYARFLADRMQGPRFRNLLLIIIRNGSTATRVSDAYNRRIIGKACGDFERAVLEAGRMHGTTILLKDGAAKRLYKRIETLFALPGLLPECLALTPSELVRALDEIVGEAFSCTYAFEWESQKARTA